MPAGIHRPDSNIQTVVGIQFGIFSPEEIEKRSVVEITNSGTYDGLEPRIGGLFDPRMGVLDNGRTCRSCGQTNHGCPGHFGHYRLARPVYFIQFFSYIINVLNCVCVRCSKLLIDKELHKSITKRKGEARWRAVLTKCSGISRCGQETEDGCGAIQPDRYVRDGIARITAEWANMAVAGEGGGPSKTQKVTQVLEVEYVLKLFRRITDEDVDFMGLNRFWCRPDWMICSVLPIPPPQVRPSVIQDNNQRSEDDLTHKMFEIISTNQRLQDKINNNAAKNLIEDEHTVLQYHIATLVDNQIPGVAPSAQRSGRPLKSVQQRLGSKEGRIRYNIQGKRVEFSARSVITPDPNISIGEIGVPLKIAINLTVPEKVTPYNKQQMYKLIQNGADKHPGAKTIVSANGSIKSLKHVNRKEIVLHVGDVINRHLDDGDIILFNRQPTLHRMSMMGHRVKVLPYNTFRLNVSVTAPYNADFDGDEMNAHIPQSYEASTELAEIAAVPHQIVTPRHAKPLIGIVQDTLVGSYRITQPHVIFNRREFMNMMMWNKRFEGIVPVAERKIDGRPDRWTGQQVLSQLMPPINIEMGNGMYKENKTKDNLVKIREGKITQGIFDKEIFSKPSKGIVHVTYRDYGPKDTVQLIDSMQNTVEQFLVYNGFSVGVSDLIADENTRKEMEEVVKKRKAAIENILLQIHLDLFDNNTGKTNQQEFEDKVFTELNKATEESGKIGLGSLADENRLVAMVRAGSKGSTINISQMMACVGQQAPEGRRIPYGFTDRTLPHFKKYDDGAEARGFVESSFIQGLTPQEFFFHAMSGREGLIDTAVKTADTGYIQRQLVKAMEDLAVQYDGSVRDSRMNIVQFKYGEDGVNATKIESASLGIGKLSTADIMKEYGMQGVDMSALYAEGVLTGDDAAAIEGFANKILEDRKMLVEGVQNSRQDIGLFASVNIERVITNVVTSFRLTKDAKTDLTPTYVIQGIERLTQRTQAYHRLWAAMLRYYLAPHKVIVKERMTRKAFDTACEMILLKNWQGWAQPGEQVGIIAAQSIGEPSTQMSCLRHAFVNVSTDGGNHAGPIGDLIDKLLERHVDDVIEIGPNSVVLDLTEDMYITGVSNDEKTSWKRISQVSRHPANGGLVKVTTKSGRSTTATLTHSFLKRTEKGVEPVLGSDLRVGMRVPIATNVEQVPEALIKEHGGFTLDRDFGWLCGIYLADGCFMGNTVSICKIHPIVETSIRALAAKYGWPITVRNYEGEYGPAKSTNIHDKALKEFLLQEFNTGSYKKTIGPISYSAPREFQYGLIGGYFDGDGNVNAERHQIRVGSRSNELIRHMNRLLSYCGLFSVMSQEASVRMPGKTMYTVCVLKKYAALFKERIGFRLSEKADALDKIVSYMEREGKHDTKEIYDKIPAVGDTIAKLGLMLEMPGQSRHYGRWAKKESVGRLTLQKYISEFKAAAATSPFAKAAAPLIESLESAGYSDVVWDEITTLEYMDDPKEFVYDFTVPGNDSFMVDDAILVHNTLNSVDWDTKIMIAKNGKIVCTEIGAFVDQHMAANPDSIQEFPNDQLYLDLKDGNDWQAVSCDESGKMMWTKLEAVTRHPVLNEDGTNTILEVELASGRMVKATKGKSFLTRVGDKVMDINGSDLRIGDVLPIANSLAIESLPSMKSLSMREHLPPTEYLYGTDAAAALVALNGADRHWFQKNNGSAFTIPYSRSDAFREAFIDGKNTNAAAIRPGFVYPARTRPDVSQIPAEIPLTESFGFFVGAYLAEGMSNATQVNITNNDTSYLAKVAALMAEWNVGTHTVSEQRDAAKSGIKGTTTSLVIHSTILATLLRKVFGRVSHEKTMPDWVFQAPDEFVQGLVDGYISGDGTVENKTGCVKATSVSKDLLVRMGTLFARFGIFSTLSERMPEQGVFDSVKTNYTMYIPVKYSAVFAKTFRLSIPTKQAILDGQFGPDSRLRTCRRETTGDMVWDTIKSIKEVIPMKDRVYDLTVEMTRNFMTMDCIGVKDTFHLAGVAAKSNVTRGVPRLKELLKVTQNPKAISLTVTLKPEIRDSKEKARKVAQDLELTLLKDITVKAAIYYDPDDSDSVLQEDRDLVKFYRAFETEMEPTQEVAEARFGEDGVPPPPPEEKQAWSRLMLRLELDRQRMFRKNISMDDIAFVLRQNFGDAIHLVYSDYNTQRLIMRIRIPPVAADDTGMDDMLALKKLQNRLLTGIVIRGVSGIKAVTFRQDKDVMEYSEEGGIYKQITQYVLDTDGTNFLAVMNHPYVDGTKLVSSHVHDIYENLGIEATRSTLIQEITTLFEEAGVNYRHLGLLCDVMTRQGRLMSVDRYGINKMDIGPIAKASFEETEKILLRAALFGEVDPVTGISANIMMGQPIRGGTGFFNVLLDEGAFMRLQEGLPSPTEEDDEDDDGPTEEQIARELAEDQNDICSTARLRMNVAMPQGAIIMKEPDIDITILRAEDEEA